MSAPLSPPITPSNVLVGPAAVYIAPKGTPLPADHLTLFDPTPWTGKTLNANGATSVTLQVTNSQGTQSTAALASFATTTAAQLQAALEALSNVGTGNVTVTGAVAGGPFVVTFKSTLGAVTLSVSASTGGTGPTVTGGLWVPPGATESGWTFGASKQTQTINVEEQSTPVGKFITSQSVTIAANLAEDSQATWQFALNAVKTLIAPGVGQPGVTVLTLSDTLQHYAVAMEALNEYGYPTMKYIPDAVSAETLSVAYRRAQAQRMLNVSFESVCATSEIVTRAVTAPGT